VEHPRRKGAASARAEGPLGDGPVHVPDAVRRPPQLVEAEPGEAPQLVDLPIRAYRLARYGSCPMPGAVARSPTGQFAM
jgi:hypothetical protein